MQLGYVTCEGKGQTDRLLTHITERLEAAGLHLAGTVQLNTERADRALCDMDLRLLPDGPIVRISVDRGPQARGCRLDAGALEQSVLWTSKAIEDSNVQMLIVNKFGKREAESKGLAPVIAQALERGIPVLVGVNALNMQAFLDFSDGLATSLPPDADQVVEWCLSKKREYLRL